MRRGKRLVVWEDAMQQDEQPERMVYWRAPLAARMSVQAIAGLVLGVGTGYLGTIFGGYSPSDNVSAKPLCVGNWRWPQDENP